MDANNINEMREALVQFVDAYENTSYTLCLENLRAPYEKAKATLAEPHTGKWMNGRKYEYEYAYCSECGRMQWADWDTHKQAEESIGSFADSYRFCPGCGAKMEGGVYVK